MAQPPVAIPILLPYKAPARRPMHRPILVKRFSQIRFLYLPQAMESFFR